MQGLCHLDRLGLPDLAGVPEPPGRDGSVAAGEHTSCVAVSMLAALSLARVVGPTPGTSESVVSRSGRERKLFILSVVVVVVAGAFVLGHVGGLPPLSVRAAIVDVRGAVESGSKYWPSCNPT